MATTELITPTWELSRQNLDYYGDIGDDGLLPVGGTSYVERNPTGPLSHDFEITQDDVRAGIGTAARLYTILGSSWFEKPETVH